MPDEYSAQAFRYLLVEPNNTGFASDDFDVHLEAAKKLSTNGFGAVAGAPGAPLLIPVFPRPKAIGRFIRMRSIETRCS